jgi:hypothetical protein
MVHHRPLEEVVHVRICHIYIYIYIYAWLHGEYILTTNIYINTPFVLIIRKDFYLFLFIKELMYQIHIIE